MKTKVGLWIDRRKATVVAITEKGEEIKEIISEVEKQPRRSGDSPLKGTYESRQVPADNSRQRSFTEHHYWAKFAPDGTVMCGPAPLPLKIVQVVAIDNSILISPWTQNDPRTEEKPWWV